MITRYNSPDAPSSGNRYAQAIGIANATELVLVSGQIGAEPDGTIPQDFEEQCRLVWRNIAAQLAEASMTLSDLVKITAIVPDRANIPAYRAVREELLGDHQVASTGIVAELFDERWQVEIEGIAAR